MRSAAGVPRMLARPALVVRVRSRPPDLSAGPAPSALLRPAASPRPPRPRPPGSLPWFQAPLAPSASHRFIAVP